MTSSAPARIADNRPSETLHVARCRGGIVALDADRDAYHGFYRADDDMDGVADAITETFAASDIRQLASHRAHLSSGLDEPVWQDCEPDWRARLRLRDMAVFVAALLACAIRFHALPFASLVRQRGRSGPDPSLAHYRTAVARFRRMSAFLPFSMQCLFRSHFLLHFLRGYGLRADWIFGVSLFPFQAHCWLAVGRSPLLDQTEKLEDFVPIMVVHARPHGNV